MKEIEKKYQCIPFWSWNDELDEKKLIKQIDWMYENGVGGFFMHARGGLKTPYLGEKWFSCIEACEKRAQELGMNAYAYDENGWPSGFVGGKLLEQIENHDMYLTYSKGKYDSKAIASYIIKDNKLIRVNNGDDCLNVYANYSVSTVDILNPDVVDQFIELTHKQYKTHDKYNALKGFFTDEPQYYRWNLPFTKMLIGYFKDKYNEDILDRLGLIFVKLDGYEDFRYKYWKAMNDLIVTNFGKKIYEYCDSNNYCLTGHYVEEVSLAWQMTCCAGIMPLYEYEHIPGIDLLGRYIGTELAAKQVGSVAAQLDKKQVIGEMFAMVGWDASPLELKRSAEYLYVDGVNLMCQHLLPYSEYGQRKRDYPEHFSQINPWVREHFKEFNDYFSFLGKHLSNSTEIVNVGVLHPIRSAYFNYDRNDEAHGFGIADLDNSFFELIHSLSSKHIPHHFIDETILAKHGYVNNNQLVVGKCTYDYLIIPYILTMDKSTEKLIHEYVSNGGKVLLYKGKPTHLEGQKYDYSYLKNNTSLNEIINSLPFNSDENANIKLSYRLDEKNIPYFYIVNLEDKASFNLNAKNFKNFKAIDLVTDESKIISSPFQLEKYQSCILYPTNEDLLSTEKKEKLTLNKEYKLVEPIKNNYLVLDFAKYSFNGVDYSEKLHHMGIFDELLKKRYKGKLYLKFDFDVHYISSCCDLILENDQVEEVYINNNKVSSYGVSKYEDMMAVYDIKKHLKEGNNEIIIVLDYYQSDDVYYALFGENVTESLKNCLVYNTNIEPIFIRGDFGVYGKFEDGHNPLVYIGKDLYIDKQKNTIKSLILDGFPFFSGNIKVKQNINVDTTNKYLQIEDRFNAVSVNVNNQYAGSLVLKNKLDLSNYLTKGSNEIILDVTISNRNLFGPFHTLQEEDFGVSPYSFERTGSWVNGKSELLRETYSFVKSFI